MDTQDYIRDLQCIKEMQEQCRNIETLQDICARGEIEAHGGTVDELVVNVRKRVVDMVCTPLLQNSNVEVMTLPASLIAYNSTTHPVVATSVTLSFNQLWIGNGPFTIYDASTFEPKPATLEDVLVMSVASALGNHLRIVLKEVTKLIIYVPLQLSMSNLGLIAKTRYAMFAAPY
jgi:hypothetical protein